MTEQVQRQPRAVHVEGLYKSFGSGVAKVDVLEDVSIDVERGELIAIVGPSGSGKSTLLHILGTLDPPDAGSVSLSGVDPYALPAEQLAAFRNQRLGFVFQFHQLLPDFNAVENVALPARIAGRSVRASQRSARALLDEVGLSHRANALPNELSGGERQRVALCRALSLEPELLLADEPTGNLDPKSADQVLELFLALRERRETTTLLVTHNPLIANRCGRVFELDRRRLRPLESVASQSP